MTWDVTTTQAWSQQLVQQHRWLAGARKTLNPTRSTYSSPLPLNRWVQLPSLVVLSCPNLVQDNQDFCSVQSGDNRENSPPPLLFSVSMHIAQYFSSRNGVGLSGFKIMRIIMTTSGQRILIKGRIAGGGEHCSRLQQSSVESLLKIISLYNPFFWSSRPVTSFNILFVLNRFK